MGCDCCSRIPFSISDKQSTTPTNRTSYRKSGIKAKTRRNAEPALFMKFDYKRREVNNQHTSDGFVYMNRSWPRMQASPTNVARRCNLCPSMSRTYDEIRGSALAWNCGERRETSDLTSDVAYVIQIQAFNALPRYSTTRAHCGERRSLRCGGYTNSLSVGVIWS